MKISQTGLTNYVIKKEFFDSFFTKINFNLFKNTQADFFLIFFFRKCYFITFSEKLDL